MTSKFADTKSKTTAPTTKTRPAEIVREYGPFPGVDKVGGVTHDGRRVWAATNAGLVAFDPQSGEVARTIERPSDAGTAFDGTHLYQIAEARIDKIDPATGAVLVSDPAPARAVTRASPGPTGASGSGSVPRSQDPPASTPRRARCCARSNRTAS
jgi:hypothetical protein